MKTIKDKFLFASTSILVLLVFLLFVSGSAYGRKKQPGMVVMATGWAAFNAVGGDPATQTGAPPYANRTVFESLASVTGEREFTPSIAKSWKIGTNWKYIDFFLRTDIRFHNGAKVTAEDVKYSLETYMRKDLKYVFGSMWRRNVKSVKIMNRKQIRVYLNTADWGFIGRLWWGGGIMPKAYREKVGDKGFAAKPIGAGPFEWVGYRQDRWFEVKAVKKHFRKTPEIKGIKVIFVPENSTRLAMLKTGEADIATLFGPHVQDVKEDPDLRVQWVRETSGSNIFYADMIDPKTPSPFHDIRVRKAVSLSIDRKAICKRLLFDASEPWPDVLPSITLGYDKTLAPPAYNTEKAKKLLAEAGYPNGFETSIHVQTTATTAEALAASLASVGIRAKVEKYEPGAYYGRFFRRKFRGLIPYVGWYDPERQAPAEVSDFYIKGMPHAYYTTDELTNILKKAMYAKSDKELAQWGRKISKYLREKHITTFLWANHSPYGLGPRIKSWQPTVGGIPGIEFETIKLAR
ncbi:MAG: ABC transporter substrate-binding protein [Proteobacteria bacterium]|nr:ABC transporter substrate-binding protein [Pseudomonadota bacterium]